MIDWLIDNCFTSYQQYLNTRSHDLLELLDFGKFIAIYIYVIYETWKHMFMRWVDSQRYSKHIFVVEIYVKYAVKKSA